MRTILPCTKGEYTVSSNVFHITTYRDFKYSNAISDVNIAVENMDAILDKAMEHIKEACGDVTYGVGISGGLDSRVIPHYAKRHGMNLVGFNICVPKPHALFLARSCKNARAVADAFKIPYSDTKWDPVTVEQKIDVKVKQYPLCLGRNSFKYEPHMPSYDVLLTGGSGAIVGSMLPNNIHSYSKEELIEAMAGLFIKSTNPRTFKSRATRAINYIFGTKLKINSKSAISELVTPSDLEKAYDDIAQFVDQGVQKGQSNIEIFEDFFINVMAFRNRWGAYESILGLKRSFSIYVPFMMKEVIKWTPDLLYNRKVLETLIRKKVPEVKDIKSELFAPAPDKKSTLFNKSLNMFDFLIRGNGAAVDAYWIKKRSVTKKLAARLGNDCTWFYECFAVEKKKLVAKVIKSNESQLMIDTWELKAFIDCLETKKYMSFNFSEEK